MAQGQDVAHLTQVLWLVLAWSAYFVLHSALASLAAKQRVARRWPGLMPAYRLIFNTLAVLLLALPLWLLYSMPGPELWRWQGVAAWLAAALSIAALGGFLWSLKYYDMAEFLGLRQYSGRVHSVEDQENFHLSPLHRYVRHPWYFLALVLIWTRDMNLSMLVSAIMLTGYFIVGSRLEERKLVQYHGDVYRRYMARVPGIFPLPWKFLRREQARELSAD